MSHDFHFEETAIKLSRAHREVEHHLPGEPTSRQPVHTVYGGAHLFKSDTAKKVGDLAIRQLQEFAPDAKTFTRALGLEWSEEFSKMIYARVLEKLGREPIEDYRIDFEDGYGYRKDEEEDGHAVQAAHEVSKGLAASSLPPFIGIRVKAFTDELFPRASRTLGLFLSTLSKATGGKLPSGFVVTLPKVTHSQEVSALVDVLEHYETLYHFEHPIAIELMVETPQALFDVDGVLNLPKFVDAARKRCRGAHFGTYDYTALCNITADYQRVTHPACDFAKNIMQVSLNGTGLMLSDGATTFMPIPPKKAKPGEVLSEADARFNRETVSKAWKMHYENVRYALERGYYQGWDLHPGQLAIRYAALYSFFLEGLAGSTSRLKNFVDKAAQATLAGNHFDDAATGQGLLNFFLRGTSCGALTALELKECGLSIDEIKTRSFLSIVEGRR